MSVKTKTYRKSVLFQVVAGLHDDKKWTGAAQARLYNNNIQYYLFTFKLK